MLFDQHWLYVSGGFFISGIFRLWFYKRRMVPYTVIQLLNIKINIVTKLQDSYNRWCRKLSLTAVKDQTTCNCTTTFLYNEMSTKQPCNTSLNVKYNWTSNKSQLSQLQHFKTKYPCAKKCNRICWGTVAFINLIFRGKYTSIHGNMDKQLVYFMQIKGNTTRYSRPNYILSSAISLF